MNIMTDDTLNKLCKMSEEDQQARLEEMSKEELICLGMLACDRVEEMLDSDLFKSTHG